MSIAGAAQATEDRVDLANIDGNLRLEMRDRTARPVVVTEHFVYYDVSGHTERDVRRQMTKNGTKWDDGKTYDSVTTWNINWDYDYNCTAEGCKAEAFNSTVKVTFRYPKWVTAESAPQTLREKWDGYMKNLVLHEHGHRDMAVEATEELARAVSALPPAPSRAELDRQVKLLSKKMMAKLDSDQIEYDATTVHGTTQGAVFP
jgi:predicted secreted Zn-dependent protease